MLTKDTRLILKRFRLLSENGKNLLVISQNSNAVYVQSAGKLNGPEIIECDNPYAFPKQVAFLASQGYLITSNNVIELTYAGLHPYKLSLLELRHFLIKSVLIPICVSLATSLTTLLLTKVL